MTKLCENTIIDDLIDACEEIGLPLSPTYKLFCKELRQFERENGNQNNYCHKQRQKQYQSAYKCAITKSIYNHKEGTR